jgi:hypothetical protein
MGASAIREQRRRDPAARQPIERLPKSPVAVMIFAGNDLDVAVLDPVHKTVFSVDASGPEPGQLATKWLRFTDAFVTVAHDVRYQVVDSLDQLAVRVTEVLRPSRR